MEQGKAEKTKEPAYYATTTPMNIKKSKSSQLAVEPYLTLIHQREG